MTRLREDRGSALISAMLLMAVMIALGIALLGTVDVQQRESGTSRTRETAFNLAESAMNAQVFALAQEWPGLGDAATPYAPCTEASTGARCPSAAILASLSASVDTSRGMAWATAVRDNGGMTQSHYTDAGAAAQPGYDANGDGRLWVRAQGTADGRTRAMVTQVRVEEAQEDLPRAAIIAGRLDISNNGKKVIVDASASTGTVPTVQVRCTVTLLDLLPCLGHTVTGTLSKLLGLLDSQLLPNVTTQGYAEGNALSEDAKARLRIRAIADGTYYATCPSSPPAGQVVWIAAGNCSWTGNAVVNSAESPGVLILEHASLYLGGTIDLHGIVYATNPASTTNTLIQVQGNARVLGGVLIDGQATMVAGSSKFNVVLALDAFEAARSYVTAGMVQNTWRELSAAGV